MCILATDLVVRNSMSLLVFSSDSVEDSSSSSRSAVMCGRFPMLPPRLTLEEVEDELSPESATGDACHSRRKSNPPVQTRVWFSYTMHAGYKTGHKSVNTNSFLFLLLCLWPCLKSRLFSISNSPVVFATCLYDQNRSQNIKKMWFVFQALIVSSDFSNVCLFRYQ